MDNFDGSERFDVHLRAFAPDAAKHVEVVIKLQPWMQPTDDMHLRRAGIGSLARGGDHLLERHLIRAFFAALPIERTELAREGADVGVIDMAIAIEIRAAAMQFLADVIGEAADTVDVGALIERDAFGLAEPLA